MECSACHHSNRAGRRFCAALDVLACPQCGGRLRFIAAIEDPAVIQKILTHMGLPTDLPVPAPSRAPPAETPVFDFPD